MIKYLYILPIIYFTLFILFTFIKTLFPSSKKIIFCSVCASYFTALIIGFIIPYPPIILAFALGMTITGISYKFLEYLENKNKNFIMDFFIIQTILMFIGLIIIYLYI